MSRKVTIDEIARQSNASRTTVSLVLRDKPGIGSDTRERVWAAAQSLGYQRRATAPVAVGADVLNIGLIQRARYRIQESRHAGVNSFYSWVLAGIESAAGPQRMNLLYATLEADERNRAMSLPEHLLGQRLDGILMIGSFSEETIAEVASRSEATIVLVDAPAGSHRYDAIVSDNEGGAYRAVRHLLELGHRQIAHISSTPQADPNFRQRQDGYVRAMREQGLAEILAPMATFDAGEATSQLLTRRPDVTALFVCNDNFALKAIRAATQQGRRVPDDLSVVGFDDVDLASQFSPALTTMSVDRMTMGRLAIQALSNRLAWQEAATMLTVLRPELVVRESSAAVAGRVVAPEAGV